MKKIAVVMSGHARMVPQGDHLQKCAFTRIPDAVDWQQYSYCWTAASEVRPANHEQQQQFDLRDRILEGLAHRHHYEDQDAMFDLLCDRFIDQGALPDYRRTNPAVATQIRYHFGKYLGQLLGFCLAVDRWRGELENYDYIVRTRWDHALDPFVLEMLDPEFFYTKSINIWDGRPIISGDTIYGSTDKWLRIIPSTEEVIKRLIFACRRLRSELAVKQPEYNFTQDFQWYTTHYLWYVLIENEPVRLLHKGESFNINYELSKIPLEELTLEHAAYGIDLYYKNKSIVRPMPLGENMLINKQIKIKELQVLSDHRRRRQEELDAKIKGQNPR